MALYIICVYCYTIVKKHFQGWYLVPLCQLLITALAEPVRDDEIKVSLFKFGINKHLLMLLSKSIAIFQFLIFMLCTFKAEIEIAARDSALLAEELAHMLERLENDDDSDQETISVISTELGKIKFTVNKCNIV